MKILLVAINAKYIHSNPAVYSLKSCAGEYASCVDIAEFTINQQPAYILQEIYKRQPDVIAFSCYIWNRSVLDAIIPDLHKLLPQVDIWAGGPEVSYDAAETIHNWRLRGVMTGPGEAVFSRLTAAYAAGAAQELPAILDGGKTQRLKLDDIPFWYEDMQDFEHRIVYYESSRGCPFSCSYCLSSIDRAMDFRSTERVCRELDFFLAKKVPQVKFVDRTFNCKKDHALPILRHILEHDNGVTNFHFEIAADLLDEDYFSVMEQLRPGAVQLEIGVQSTCEETIAEICRKMNFSRVAAIVRRISSWKNIHVHLDLIAGLPFEDMPRFQTSFNDVYALRPQQLQLGFLKVLKGADMERHAPEYELLYTSQPPYEVLSTRWLSYEDICHLKQVEEMVEIYYNSGQFVNTLEFLLSYFDNAYAMYDSLAAWYERYGLFGMQSSRIRKYEILLEFGSAHVSINAQEQELPSGQTETNRQFTADGQVIQNGHNSVSGQAMADIQITMLREYLLYDLYLREHMKNRPAFAASLEPWKNAIHDILHKESLEHALFPELADCNYRELTKALHVEVFTSIFDQPTAVLFGYERRDPLTNNVTAAMISLETTQEENAVKGTQNEGKEVKIMEHDYKYISENCLEELSLHDCICSHLYFQDGRLIFEMDWMEVLASHPLNPYPQAHQSGPGRIELIHPEIIECSLIENETAHHDCGVLQLTTVEELDFSDTEFRYCTETKTDMIYQAEMYLAFYEMNPPYYAISIHIAYEKSIVMWDALNDVSWFEDEM